MNLSLEVYRENKDLIGVRDMKGHPRDMTKTGKTIARDIRDIYL